IWPVAMLHGALNAFVHVNRLGIEIQPSLLRAAALAFAPLPLCIYGAILLRKTATYENENAANPALTSSYASHFNARQTSNQSMQRTATRCVITFSHDQNTSPRFGARSE